MHIIRGNIARVAGLALFLTCAAFGAEDCRIVLQFDTAMARPKLFEVVVRDGKAQMNLIDNENKIISSHEFSEKQAEDIIASTKALNLPKAVKYPCTDGSRWKISFERGGKKSEGEFDPSELYEHPGETPLTVSEVEAIKFFKAEINNFEIQLNDAGFEIPWQHLR